MKRTHADSEIAEPVTDNWPPELNEVSEAWASVKTPLGEAPLCVGTGWWDDPALRQRAHLVSAGHPHLEWDNWKAID